MRNKQMNQIGTRSKKQQSWTLKNDVIKKIYGVLGSRLKETKQTDNYV